MALTAMVRKQRRITLFDRSDPCRDDVTQLNAASILTNSEER
jgi:hypothetical protein